MTPKQASAELSASEVYLRAAKIIDEDAEEFWQSCCAISAAAGGTLDLCSPEYDREHPFRIRYAEMFGFSSLGDCPEIEAMDALEAKQFRVLMLTLMSAIAADKERK